MYIADVLWGTMDDQSAKNVLTQLHYMLEKVTTCAPQRDEAFMPYIIVLHGLPRNPNAPHDENDNEARHGRNDGTRRGV